MHTILSFLSAIVISVSSWFGTHPAAISQIQDNPIVSAIKQAVSSTTQTAATTPVVVESNDSLPSGSAWLTTLPLGDNKYVTDAPKQGYIYLCNVQNGGQGAQVNGPWIHGTTWNPAEKIHVQGNVSWPEATYKMSISGSDRLIASNDLPTDHTTGIFPISASDPAAQYDRNPGTILAHSYSFTFPAYPAAAAKPGCIYGEVGIMNNGVLLFDGFDAMHRDALAHELQDNHDGHPNDEGYHKHGFINDIKNVAVSQVVGFAFDGYPITGPKLTNGNYLATADLDVCHGMTSTVTLDGKEMSTYHYVLTQDFPYSVSCFHGTSKVTPQTLKAQGAPTNDAAGMQKTAPAMGSNTPPAPPAEAIAACTGKATGAMCTVGANVSGSCAMIGASFACLPKER